MIVVSSYKNQKEGPILTTEGKGTSITTNNEQNQFLYTSYTIKFSRRESSIVYLMVQGKMEGTVSRSIISCGVVVPESHNTYFVTKDKFYNFAPL